MYDISFFLEKLKEMAKQHNDEELLNKINDSSFYKSLNDVCYVFNHLNMEVIDATDTFSYQKEMNLKISRALIQNYFVIYYVNLTTNEYISYTNDKDYESLKIETSGEDFFGNAQRNAENVIYKDDLELVLKNVNKERILKGTENNETFSFTYRLMLNNIPTYVTLKANRLIHDENNMIIGISNIDALKRHELEYKKKLDDNITFNNIALALAQNYFVIYYLNIKTNAYLEYRINNETNELILKNKGKDFFSDSKMNARRYIFPEDQEKFLKAINKKYLLKEINNSNSFSLTYRQIINNETIYVSMKCLKLNTDSNHILVAVSNINEEKKKENEYKKRIASEKLLARTDALTGALNKYSYKEFEKEINKQILKQNITEFAVVVFDINGLKETNDTLGHDAGDNLIKSAKSLIGKVFKENTIFRIGGDEFAIILDGDNYYIRDYLIKKFTDISQTNLTNNDVVVACGMSEFDSSTDQKLLDVFIKADSKMYENKAYLKNIEKGL